MIALTKAKAVIQPVFRFYTGFKPGLSYRNSTTDLQAHCQIQRLAAVRLNCIYLLYIPGRFSRQAFRAYS